MSLITLLRIKLCFGSFYIKQPFLPHIWSPEQHSFTSFTKDSKDPLIPIRSTTFHWSDEILICISSARQVPHLKHKIMQHNDDFDPRISFVSSSRGDITVKIDMISSKIKTCLSIESLEKISNLDDKALRVPFATMHSLFAWSIKPYGRHSPQCIGCFVRFL